MMGWWTISGEGLLDLLRRAHAGEDPDLIYAEEYANSEHEYPEEEIETEGGGHDDLASRLGWLPCGRCEISGEWTDVYKGNFDVVRCSSCHGVGWLPSPTILEAMARVLYETDQPNHGFVPWSGGDNQESWFILARAAWEAQARMILERRKP